MAATKKDIKYIEPQSMNFEKKLSEAYIEFKEAMDKKAEKAGEKTIDDKEKGEELAK